MRTGIFKSKLSAVTSQELIDFKSQCDTLYAANPDSLIFKSSFDTGVVFTTASTYNHRITGTDSVSGYTWPDDLPGRHYNDGDGLSTDGYFNYTIASCHMPIGGSGCNNDGLDVWDFVNTSIENVVGPHGSNVNALYQEYHNDDSDSVTSDRNQYSLDSREPQTLNPIDGELNDLYFHYYIKQNNYHTRSKYNLMFEMKTHDESQNQMDFRWGLYILWLNDVTPYWQLKTQHVNPDWSLGSTDNYEENHTMSVPLNEWYKFELYVNHRTEEEGGGFIKVAINDEVLFNFQYRTKKSMPVDALWPLKIYGDYGEMWTTDFQIHTQPPATSVLA